MSCLGPFTRVAGLVDAISPGHWQNTTTAPLVDSNLSHPHKTLLLLLLLLFPLLNLPCRIYVRINVSWEATISISPMYVVTAVHKKGGSHVAINQDSFCHCKVKTKLNSKSLIQIFQIIFLVSCFKLLKCIALVYFLKTDWCYMFLKA